MNSVASVMIEGQPIENMPFAEATEQVVALASADRASYIVTANLNHLRMLRANEPGFRDAYAGASLRFADGIPLLWAANVAGTPIQARVAGSDLEPAICRRLEGIPGSRVVYIGGRPEVNEDAKEARRRKFPGLDIGGYSPPPDYEKDPSAVKELVEFVNQQAAETAGPLAVMLCTGAPKSEIVAARNLGDIKRGVIVPAGAAIDFAAGEKTRASEQAQNRGTEWLHRVVQEPRRLGPRYTRDAGFLVGLVARSAKARVRATPGPIVQNPV